jgi:hypothetical protein
MSGTVTVASRLPIDILISSVALTPGGNPQFSHVILGNRDPLAVDGLGLTYDVDATTFTDWQIANRELAASTAIATQQQIDHHSDPTNIHGYELGLAPPVVPPIETAPPVNVDVPYVSQTGNELHCTMGNWENEPLGYHYQWMQDGTMEIGPDSNTLALVPSDGGHTMTCIVQAYNAGGTATAPPSNGVLIPVQTQPTAAELTSGAFDDQEMSGLVGDIGSNPTAWLGFDVVVDGTRRTVRQQFVSITAPQDICNAVNSQLGAWATMTMPATAAPYSFHITSMTTGAASTLSYGEPPSYVADDLDPLKVTTDISISLRLRQTTGAVVVQGTDVVATA